MRIKKKRGRGVCARALIVFMTEKRQENDHVSLLLKNEH